MQWHINSRKAALANQGSKDIRRQVQPRNDGPVGATAGLVDAPDLPLAGKDSVVRPVLINAGAETGRAELEGHQSIATETDDAA